MKPTPLVSPILLERACRLGTMEQARRVARRLVRAGFVVEAINRDGRDDDPVISCHDGTAAFVISINGTGIHAVALVAASPAKLGWRYVSDEGLVAAMRAMRA